MTTINVPPITSTSYGSSSSKLVTPQFVVNPPSRDPNTLISQIIDYLKKDASSDDESQTQSQALIQFVQTPLFSILAGLAITGGVSFALDLLPSLIAPKELTPEQRAFVDQLNSPKSISKQEVIDIIHTAKTRLAKDYDPFKDEKIAPLLERHFLTLFSTPDQVKAAKEEFKKLFLSYSIRTAHGILTHVITDCDGPYAFKNLLQPEDACKRTSDLQYIAKILSVSATARLSQGIKQFENDPEILSELLNFSKMAEVAISSGYYETNGSAKVEEHVRNYFARYTKHAFSLKKSEIDKLKSNPETKLIAEILEHAKNTFSPFTIVTARAGIHTTSSELAHPNGKTYESGVEGSAWAETGLSPYGSSLGEHIGVLGVGGLRRFGDNYEVSEELIRYAKIFRRLLSKEFFSEFPQEINKLNPRVVVPKGITNAALILDEAQKALTGIHGDKYKLKYNFTAEWFDKGICETIASVRAKLEAGDINYDQARRDLISSFEPFNQDDHIIFTDKPGELKTAELKLLGKSGKLPIHSDAYQILEKAHFTKADFEAFDDEMRGMLTNDIVYHTIRSSLRVLDPNDSRTEPDKEQTAQILNRFFESPDGKKFLEMVDKEYHLKFIVGVRADQGYPEGRKINAEYKPTDALFNTVNNSKTLNPKTKDGINKFFVLHQASYSELVAGQLAKTAAIFLEKMKELAPTWSGDSPSDTAAGGAALISHPLSLACNVRNLVLQEDYMKAIFEQLDYANFKDRLECNVKKLRSDLINIWGQNNPLIERTVSHYEQLMKDQHLAHPLVYKVEKDKSKKIVACEIVGGEDGALKGMRFEGTDSVKKLKEYLESEGFMKAFFDQRLYRQLDTEQNLVSLALASGITAGFSPEKLDQLLHNPALALDVLAPDRYMFQQGGSYNDLDMPKEFRIERNEKSRNIYHPIHAMWLRMPFVSERMVAGGMIIGSIGALALLGNFIKDRFTDSKQPNSDAEQSKTDAHKADQADNIGQTINDIGHQATNAGFLFANLGYLVRTLLCDSTPQPLSVFGNLIGIAGSLLPFRNLQDASLLASLAANIGGWFNRTVLWGQAEVYKPDDHNKLMDELQCIEKEYKAALAKNPDGSLYLDGKLTTIPAYEYTILQMKRDNYKKFLSDKGVPETIADLGASVGQVFYATHRVLTKPGLLHDALFVWHPKTDIVRGNPILKPHIDGYGLALGSALPIAALAVMGVIGLVRKIAHHEDKDTDLSDQSKSEKAHQNALCSSPQIKANSDGSVTINILSKTKASKEPLPIDMEQKDDQNDQSASQSDSSNNQVSTAHVVTSLMSTIPSIVMIPTALLIRQYSLGDPLTANLYGKNRQLRARPVTNSRLVLWGGLTSATCSVLSLVPGIEPLFSAGFTVAELSRALGLSNYQMLWYGQAHDNAAQFGGFRIPNSRDHITQLVEARQKGWLQWWPNGKRLTQYVDNLLSRDHSLVTKQTNRGLSHV
ncbi:MAG: hypothetical protein SFT81_04705 [Candidatus Caenarcaniphilales bacterium]|nr:hypothetical protein [Candidatus Caenarcaniphilales bacterium]